MTAKTENTALHFCKQTRGRIDSTHTHTLAATHTSSIYALCTGLGLVDGAAAATVVRWPLVLQSIALGLLVYWSTGMGEGDTVDTR